jgi:modulator of FtsH protease
MYDQRYARPYGGGAAAVSTPALLGQVLGITGVGFLITALSSYLFRDISQGAAGIAMFAGLALVFVMNFTRRNPRVALLMFYGFAFLEGIGIAPIIAHYVNGGMSDVVVNAAGTTGAGMLAMGAAAYTFSVDWRRFSGLAMGALMILIIVGIASLFFHFLSPTVYSWAILAIFTVITLGDFSRIRAGGGGASAVDLAIAIYLDALNIFLALLQLFGAKSRDD